MLGRAIWEQFVEIFTIALIRAEFFLDRFGQDSNGRSNLIFLIIATQEIHHFPGIVARLADA